MFLGFWNAARANKENIFYSILTVFLLERVRRGWNRLEARGRANNVPADVVESRQHWFMFRAALLYALPLLIPAVKYVYRSVDELARYVDGLAVLGSLWALAVVAVLVEAFLAVVIYNLLGIYVERMNGALGFFRKMGRSVVDGSKLAKRAVDKMHASATASARAGGNVGRNIVAGARLIGSGVGDGARIAAGRSLAVVRATPMRVGGASRRVVSGIARLPRRAARTVASQLNIIK